jgi:hypothetical protein
MVWLENWSRLTAGAWLITLARMAQPPRFANASETLHTIQAVALRWNVHSNTVERWIRRYRLPIVGPSANTLRIPESSLQRLLKLKLICPACRQPVKPNRPGAN